MKIRKLSELKIKYQFGLMILLAVLLVSVVQTFYYVEITRVANSKEETYTSNSIDQVVETTNLILDKLSKAAFYFAYSSNVQTFMASSDPLEIFSTKKYIEDMIKTGLEINDDIENVVLLTPEWKKMYYYDDAQISEVLDKLQSQVIDNRDSGFIYIPGGPIGNHDAIAYYMPVVYSGADFRRGETLGSIVIFLSPQILRNIVEQAGKPDDSEFYIVDNHGQVIASNFGQRSSSSGTYLDVDELSQSRTSKPITKLIGNTGWRMVGVINGSRVLQDYEFFKSFAIVIGVIMVLLLVGLGWIFNRSFVGPLSTLFKEIGQIGGDDYRRKLVMPYKNEIKGIAIHLNRMLWKLENVTDRHLKTQQTMYEMELSRKQTELYALQSQVNPHFLFNTLQCIGGIALSKDVPEIANMTAYMSEIFNYGIKGDDDVQIRDEVFIVQQYLNIIDIRFGGKFRWDFDIDPNMLQRKTIKMIVQPLVENAVYHGLEKTYKDGRLSIVGKIEAESMLLEIRDNGPGMSAETLEKIRRALSDPVKLEKESINKQKIGIANIQWRIRLKYGELYGLNISSAADGTLVQVKLPLEPNK